MKRILPVIVLSQFFCTSVWFAVNAVMPEISRQFHLDPGFVVHLSSIIQFGFISGTLLFAITGIPDRVSPSLVFFLSALLVAVLNICIILPGMEENGLLTIRFFTGFFLAGIYPVGMKIASDHYRQGLGKSLGFLVGALVLGTSFPHFLQAVSGQLPWKYVIIVTSGLAAMGGLAMFGLVPDGAGRQQPQKFRLAAFLEGFRNKQFRAAAFGYFGHMWELYAFWVFVPLMLAVYKEHYPRIDFSVSWLSFIIIAAGGPACVLSGYIAARLGNKRTAMAALSISCTCCLLSPLILFTPSLPLLMTFLLIWGTAVIADSPLFSTMVAQNAAGSSRGSSLTIVNCIGFALTILSIQWINAWKNILDPRYIYLLLAIGPLLGLWALWRNRS